MASNLTTFDYGNRVRVKGVFTDTETGDAIDPPIVNFSFKSPDGAVSDYTFGGPDGKVKRSAVGNYYFDIDVNAAKQWNVAFWSTGEIMVRKEQAFSVPSSAIVT